MKFDEAIKKVKVYFAKEEAKINNFGSALPGYVDSDIKLQIFGDLTEEYDFGWVFYYNSAKFIETGDFQEALGGNAPLIISRKSGELIEIGTGKDTFYCIKNYVNTGDPHRES